MSHIHCGSTLLSTPEQSAETSLSALSCNSITETDLFCGDSTETHSVETPTLEKYFPGHGILIFAEAHSHSRKRACLARYVSWQYLFGFHRSFPRKDCSFAESNARSLTRALARRDITVPTGQSNMAAIS